MVEKPKGDLMDDWVRSLEYRCVKRLCRWFNRTIEVRLQSQMVVGEIPLNGKGLQLNM